MGEFTIMYITSYIQLIKDTQRVGYYTFISKVRDWKRGKNWCRVWFFLVHVILNKLALLKECGIVCLPLLVQHR